MPQYRSLSRYPERARSWRCNLAASYANHAVSYGFSAPECDVCRSDARILETVPQSIFLSRSPEKARSWRCNLAASYVNHAVSYGLSAPECEFCLSDARILETVSQHRSVSRSPERARNWRCNLAASYVNHVGTYGFSAPECEFCLSGARILETVPPYRSLSLPKEGTQLAGEQR